MSVVDYLLWALQRYILQGEKRYFAALEHHYEQILDIYEGDGQGRLYTKEDRFEVEKASPFIIDTQNIRIRPPLFGTDSMHEILRSRPALL